MAENLTTSPGLRWLTHPGEALAWFRAKLQEFYLLPAKISALRERANLVSQALVARDPVAAAKAAAVATAANRMQSDQTSLQSQVTGLLNMLGKHGIKLPGLEGYNMVPPAQLGAIPLVVVGILAGTGAVVALGISALLAGYAKQKSLLVQIEKGNLTPQEASDLAAKTRMGGAFGLGVDLTPIMWIAGVGAALYFLGPQLRRRLAA